MQITKDISTKKYPHIIAKTETDIVPMTASTFLQNTETDPNQSCGEKKGMVQRKVEFGWYIATFLMVQIEDLKVSLSMLMKK